jgi:small-conductance mechanosensitive channel
MQRLDNWFIGLPDEFLGNPAEQWTAALIVAGVTFFALLGLRTILIARLAGRAARSPSDVDELAANALRRVRAFFLLAVALAAGATSVRLPAHVLSIGRVGFVILALWQVGLLADAFVARWFEVLARRRAAEDASRAALGTILRFVARLAVWVAVVLLSLQNVGVDVTALIAGLGVGGIAIALAVQNLLGDMIASLSIALDKPFLVGDQISLDGGFTGTVESIGLKTTRLRAVSGELLVLANGELLKAKIRNFERHGDRCVVVTFRVPYETPTDALERIPTLVREVVQDGGKLAFERAHLKEFGAYALVFEVSWVVPVADFITRMDEQQRVLLAIHRRFAAEGIAFAVAAR